MKSCIVFVFYLGLSSFSVAQDLSSKDIVPLLRTGTPKQIAEAIGELDEELLQQDAVVQQLTLLLNDDRVFVKHSVGSERVQDCAWLRLLSLTPKAVLPILSRVADLKTDDERSLAFAAVERCGQPNAEAYGQLLNYCRTGGASVRSSVIRALSAVGDSSAATVEQFGRFLGDPKPSVRRSAIGALEKRHEKISVLLPIIIPLLDDDAVVYTAISNHAFEDEELRGEVARLLASVGPPAREALPKLRELTDARFRTKTRIWVTCAICSISNLPPRDALESLGKFLLADFGDEYASNHVPQAIAKLGSKALPLLAQMKLARKHASSSVRMRIASAFFAVDVATAVDNVLPLIDDSNEYVVATVVDELSSRENSEPKVVAAYVRVIGSYNGDYNSGTRAAVNAIAKLGPKGKAAIPKLEQLSQDPRLPDSLRNDVNNALEMTR